MECKRCGICCEKGGPVLHQEDLAFLQKMVTLEYLRVIRKGELAFNPFKEVVEPVPVEMIKLAGAGASWECPFHQKVDKVSVCQIHADRPMECRLLKCWDTSEIAAVTFKKCLTRLDVLTDDNPALATIISHEENCSYHKLWTAIDSFKSATTDANLAGIQEILAEDMAIRTLLIEEMHLTLPQELFYLGQPMFRMISDPAFVISFPDNILHLSYTG